MVRYIRQDHYTVSGVRYVSCAWNLDSIYWGHGMMKLALTKLLDEFMEGMEVQHVIAE